MTTSNDCFFLDRSDRVRIEVKGPDRAKFLHNLTTNDVKRLPAGQGSEAFVTSPQGKTLGYVSVLNCGERLLVRADPGGAVHVTPHLQKYGIFDDVTLADVSARPSNTTSPGRDRRVFRPARPGTPGRGRLAKPGVGFRGVGVLAVRESPLGLPGLTLIGDASYAPAVRAALHFRELDAATADAMRIQAMTPVFGRDVTRTTSPQEVGRDARAINFVKGCYLGQETVARIDALGHVTSGSA